MAKPAEVVIKPNMLNLQATMVRSNLTAGITAAKMGDIGIAFSHLADAKDRIQEIERQLADNPAKG